MNSRRPRRTSRLGKGRKTGRLNKTTNKLGKLNKAPKLVKTPEERALAEKRKNLIWLINNSGRDLKTRIQICSKLLLIHPVAFRAHIEESKRVPGAQEAKELPVLVELLFHARQCPEGDSEFKYDPNHGFREVLMHCARKLEEGIVEEREKVPLEAQSLLAALSSEAIVSDESVFDLFEELNVHLQQYPDDMASRVTLGMFLGAKKLENKTGIDKETVNDMLGRFESWPDAPTAGVEKAIFAYSKYLLAELLESGMGGKAPPNPCAVAEPKPRPVPESVLTVTQSDPGQSAFMSESRRELVSTKDDLRELSNNPTRFELVTDDYDEEAVQAKLVQAQDESEDEYAVFQLHPEPEVEVFSPKESKEPEPEPKAPEKKPAASSGPLTPKKVVDLVNVHDPKVALTPVLDKIPGNTFKKDAFVLHFLQQAREEDGLAIERKLLEYVYEQLHGDSRVGFKKASFIIGKMIMACLDEDDEDVLDEEIKNALGRNLVKTLSDLFDKSRGSLAERAEGAEPFFEALFAKEYLKLAFLTGFLESLEDKPASFREPGVQTLFRRWSDEPKKQVPEADKKVIGAIKSAIWDAFSRAADGRLKFPNDRTKDYFIKCGELVIDVLDQF